VTAEAGADITIAPSENAAAYTYSDAVGRFALCGLPANTTVYLEADGVGSRSAQVSVAPGQTSDVQIALPVEHEPHRAVNSPCLPANFETRLATGDQPGPIREPANC